VHRKHRGGCLCVERNFCEQNQTSPVVKYEPLAEPAHLQLAGENYEDKKMSLVQISWVTVPIVVRLRCCPLRFAVVRCRMGEGILGRGFLTQILGLDLKLLFEKARQTASAKGSESLVEHASVRKVSLPYLGVRYFDQEESSDDLDGLLGAGFGIDTVEDMATALPDLMQHARDNGMSSKGVETLNQLVREFRDIWAIKLGPDAQADVPPMRVQLKTQRSATPCCQQALVCSRHCISSSDNQESGEYWCAREEPACDHRKSGSCCKQARLEEVPADSGLSRGQCVPCSHCVVSTKY
jgi:hypothetical protein